MTRIVMNSMKERRRGIIVNISSGSELMPIPYVTVYSATKVYSTFFIMKKLSFNEILMNKFLKIIGICQKFYIRTTI